jgi:hypothetical protein
MAAPPGRLAYQLGQDNNKTGALVGETGHVEKKQHEAGKGVLTHFA